MTEMKQANVRAEMTFNLSINLAQSAKRNKTFSIPLTNFMKQSLFEKRTVVQSAKILPAFHGIRRLITVLTRILPPSLSPT
jgi:hypothetical protein